MGGERNQSVVVNLKVLFCLIFSLYAPPLIEAFRGPEGACRIIKSLASQCNLLLFLLEPPPLHRLNQRQTLLSQLQIDYQLDWSLQYNQQVATWTQVNQEEEKEERMIFLQLTNRHDSQNLTMPGLVDGGIGSRSEVTRGGKNARN